MTIEALLEFEQVDITKDPRVPERKTVKDFVGVYQAADNWCWAAAAASVVTSYDTTRAKGTSVFAQCLVVEAIRGAGPACSKAACRPQCTRFVDGAGKEDARQSECLIVEQDKEGFLNKALEHHGLLAGSVSLRSRRAQPSKSATPADLARLDSRMDIEAFDELLREGRLICLRTRRGGDRHFIIVYGCETYPDYSLLIWDPAHGTDVIEADRFAQEHGPFTHKIITRALVPSL